MPEIRYTLYNKTSHQAEELASVARFLLDALGEFGDPLRDIERSLQYALEKIPSFGGFYILARQEDSIVGAVVVNCTGMKGYIPENNVTYLAVDSSVRGLGIGKTLLQMAVSEAQGNLSLHVEPHNPAIQLYQKVGFCHKYNEMRLWKEEVPKEQWTPFTSPERS